MANDLEKFLQQAAERLAQKSAGKGGTAKRSSTPPAQSRSSAAPSQSSSAPTSSPRSQQRQQPSNPPPLTAQVVEEESSSDSRRGNWAREAGPDPLSTIDTRPSLLESFNQGNDRVSDHVNQVFDHQISHLRAASESLAGAPPPPSTVGVPEATGKNFLLDMLRKPDSLRAAFIASEIFKRPK